MVSFPSFVKWIEQEKNKWPCIEDLLDHIDHIANLVGIKHVGIGLDLVEGTGIVGPPPPSNQVKVERWFEIYGFTGSDGYYKYAKGLRSVSDTPNLARDLVARGYSDREIKVVLGENWLRVLKRAWGE